MLDLKPLIRQPCQNYKILSKFAFLAILKWEFRIKWASTGNRSWESVGLKLIDKREADFSTKVLWTQDFYVLTCLCTCNDQLIRSHPILLSNIIRKINTVMSKTTQVRGINL